MEINFQHPDQDNCKNAPCFLAFLLQAKLGQEALTHKYDLHQPSNLFHHYLRTSNFSQLYPQYAEHWVSLPYHQVTNLPMQDGVICEEERSGLLYLESDCYSVCVWAGVGQVGCIWHHESPPTPHLQRAWAERQRDNRSLVGGLRDGNLLQSSFYSQLFISFSTEIVVSCSALVASS